MKDIWVQPSQCLFIGDSDVDMHTGNNAGMKTAGVFGGATAVKKNCFMQVHK